MLGGKTKIPARPNLNTLNDSLMHPFQLLLAAFIVVPLLELWFLIRVGAVIGPGWTVLLVVLTAVLGAALVRAQGLATLQRIRRQMAMGEMPALEMLEGLTLFIVGALLLTPGFFTDAVGFVLLVPGVRRGLLRLLIQRGLLRPAPGARPAKPGSASGKPKPLETQWRREDD